MRPCISTSSRQYPPSVLAPWPSHLPCLTLATGSTAFHLLRWVCTFKTRSFGAVCATGWEYPFTAPPYSCPECHNTADPFGDHQVGCGGNGDRITRHNAIRDVVFSAAQSAALAPSKEMPNLIPDSLSRPADVFLPTWSRGRPAALDVHVISPLQQQTMGEAASTPGHALQVGVQRKLASHLSACRSVGVEFIPFVMETLGGLAEDSIFILRSLGKAIAQRVGSLDTSTETSVCTKQLFHRTAIALWRGNATQWLHRQPTLPPSTDGFV